MKTTISPGSRIEDAIGRAVNLSRDTNEDVMFDFNGVPVSVSPTSEPHVVLRHWQDEMNRQAREYPESPEGRLAKADRDREIASKQTTVNALLACLPEVLTISESRLMGWLDSFTENANDRCVDFDKTSLSATLVTAGYKRNDCVGMEPELIGGSRELMGRYIVGQVIDFLDQGMPPHPVTCRFAEQYLVIA